MSAPTAKTCRAVDERDRQCCKRCGISLEVVAGSRHHRKRRRDGGHETSNLVLLCGSGTTGCHGWAHANPAAARASGYIILANGRGEPSYIPVRAFKDGAFQWVQLDNDGGETPITEQFAMEILFAFGQLTAEVA
jgi:hypothetical protein